MAALSGRVAVVTGASRGIGKGIALALGAEGRHRLCHGAYGDAGLLSAARHRGRDRRGVDRRGGKGIAVQVDHANDDAGGRAVRPGRAQSRAGSTSWSTTPSRCPRISPNRSPSGKSRCPTGRWSMSACVPTSLRHGTRHKSWCRRSPA